MVLRLAERGGLKATMSLRRRKGFVVANGVRNEKHTYRGLSLGESCRVRVGEYREFVLVHVKSLEMRLEGHKGRLEGFL